MEKQTQFPLSFAQERLWFLHKLEPELSVYSIPMQMRLTGPLDMQALAWSLSELENRQEMLRTRFEEIEGQPVQIIDAGAPRRIPLVDLSNLASGEQQEAVGELVAREEEGLFDLGVGRLMRVTVLKLNEQEHILLLTMHHIISDAWSLGVLVTEMAALYEAYATTRQSPLEELAIQYVDYAVWQRDWLRGEALEKHLNYWKQHLAGLSPLLDLAADRSRPALQSYRGKQERFELGLEIREGINHFSRAERASVFMILLAGFKLLLSRYSGQEDVAVGTPVAGRNRKELEGVIGLFVNTLVLRTQVGRELSFRQLVAKERDILLDGYAHQEAPFEKIVEELAPERSLSHTPLFQTMFQVEAKAAESRQVAGLNLDIIDVTGGTARFDLTLMIREGEQNLTAVLEYSTDLYDDGTIQRLLRHYRQLLEGTLLNPDKRVIELELLTEPEKHQLLRDWNDTGRAYPAQRSIPEFFSAQVERLRDKVALVFKDQQLTYGDLNRRVNQLANHLRDRGVGPEVLVGICMEKSLEMVIGILGILKAGGAYVPLDPQYPKYRTTTVLEDSRASLIVTESALAEILPEENAELLALDNEWSGIWQAQTDEPPVSSTSRNLSHVIYTSGSTGSPKGVQIEHRSVVALMDWAQQVYSEEELSGVLASTTICFDLSVFEILVPLMLGGRVVITEDILRLEEKGAASGVTLINTVPSVMAEMVRAGAIPKNILTVNLAGEALKNGLVKEVQREGVRKIYNLYGPSEDTTYSTYGQIVSTEEPNCPIGKPISNAQAYILDGEGSVQPVGVIGEIHLSGDGLARGYMNKADLTAAAFVPNPYGQQGGERLYRTGDLGRHLPDGSLQFIRRKDEQVKVRGYRIELGEIESALNEHPEVSEAAVVAREDFAGHKRLVGYLVMEAWAELNIAEVRWYLKERLPEYMVPGLYVQLDEMPRTPNGKLNKNALPELEGLRTETRKYKEPRTDVERTLVAIWEKALGVEGIGIDDNFFELGGHSLLGSQMVSGVMSAFGIDLPLRVVFEAPTIEQMAFVILKLMAQDQDFNVLNEMLMELEQLPDFSDN